MTHSISISLDERTWLRLQKTKDETGISIEDLAAEAVSRYMAIGFGDGAESDPEKNHRQ